MLGIELNGNLIDLFEFYWNFKDFVHFDGYLIDEAAGGGEKVDLDVSVRDLLQHLHLDGYFEDGAARRIFFNGGIAILLIFLALPGSLQLQSLFELIELVVMLDHQALVTLVEISVDGLGRFIDPLRNLFRKWWPTTISYSDLTVLSVESHELFANALCLVFLEVCDHQFIDFF